MQRLTPILTPQTLKRGLTEGRYRYDEFGDIEKCCARCGEWLPADDEFFYFLKERKALASYCIACCIELKNDCNKRKREKVNGLQTPQ